MERLPVQFIRVVDVRRITPHMARVTFTGDDLGTLPLDGPDQQVKLYFPKPGQDRPVLPLPEPDDDMMRWYAAYTAIPEHERPWMRSYTIRAYHRHDDTIDVDFVLHRDAGPATRWAQSAKPGDTLGMFGPAPAFARPVPLATTVTEADWFLLVGDESALPAIGTLIEWLPAGVRTVAYVEVDGPAEEQHLPTRGDVTVHWLHRGEAQAGRNQVLLDAVRTASFPPGSVFAWLAGEAGTVRALRRHLVDERGVDKRAIDFSGYWRRRLTQDDAPTEADLADARELLAHAQELTAAAAARAEEAAGQDDETASARSVFDEAYRSQFTPWEIGGPQPAVITLERDGWLRGTVLDVGCGTGEHTIHLTRLGYDVHGVDFSTEAVVQAGAKAAERGVAARFEVADALDLGDEARYDCVLDSALFHVFEPGDRTRYVRSLHRACRPGALVHVLALSDDGPGYGPQVSDTAIREAFGEGWALEDLRAAHYRGVVGRNGETGDLPAWLARIRRL